MNKKISVLIVDDNISFANELKEFLKTKREEIEKVDVAYDGEEGYKMIVQMKPDIVIMDIIMPKGDGLTVLKKVKQLNGAWEPKWIFVTVLAGEKVKKFLYEADVQYLLLKPQTNEKIFEIIKECNLTLNYTGFKITEETEFKTSKNNVKISKNTKVELI